MAATRGTSENSKRFGTQMAIARSSKRLSARQLEERVKKIGGSISRGTIAKIESGVREVTLDEVLVLSAALDEGPFVLMWPEIRDPREEVAITDELRPPAFQVALWMVGHFPLRKIDELERGAPRPTFPGDGGRRFWHEFELLVLIWRATLMLEVGQESFVERAREMLAEIEKAASGPHGFPDLHELPLYRLAVERIEAFDALH